MRLDFVVALTPVALLVLSLEDAPMMTNFFSLSFFSTHVITVKAI